MIESSRRGLIAGASALIAAPAIIKVASLMPIKASLVPQGYTFAPIDPQRMFNYYASVLIDDEEYRHQFDR